jgi:hypothetical protein
VSQKLGILGAKENAADLSVLRELVESGNISPVVDGTYPLSEVPEAIRYLHEGNTRGKIVIVVSGHAGFGLSRRESPHCSFARWKSAFESAHLHRSAKRVLTLEQVPDPSFWCCSASAPEGVLRDCSALPRTAHGGHPGKSAHDRLSLLLTYGAKAGIASGSPVDKRGGTMSRLKNVPALGWFIAGVMVTVLLIPTAAAGAAAALSYTGIEGATGGTHANVTGAGQLEVTAAGASQMFLKTVHAGGNGGPSLVGPPKGKALIVTSIHVSATTTGGGSYTLYFVVHGIKTTIENASCPPGVTVLPFDPGLPIPSGQALYAFGNLLGVDVTVVGYTVPASAVPAGSG